MYKSSGRPAVLLALCACAAAVWWQYAGQRAIQQQQQAVASHPQATHTAPPTPVQQQEQSQPWRPSGQVPGTRHGFAAISNWNRDYLLPILSQLVNHHPFRVFRVNLYKQCQFWPDEGMCNSQDCCVAECDESMQAACQQADQLAEGLSAVTTSSSCTAGSDGGPEAPLDTAADPSRTASKGLVNPWVAPEELDTGDCLYADLQVNTEKYTGYKGEDARRIWAAIYAQPLLQQAAQALTQPATQQPADAVTALPAEQEAVFRLVSGMHSSITLSIVKNYYNDTAGTWGPNPTMYKARFGSSWAQPYLDNLFFSYVLVAQAAVKVAPQLAQLCQTQPLTEPQSSSLVAQLSSVVPLGTEAVQQLAGSTSVPGLRQRLQAVLHNTTRLVDCVGCDKCKMHAKLDVLGIATSLHHLLAPSTTGSGSHTQQPGLAMDRNAAVALINLLAKLSHGVEAVRQMSRLG